MICTMMPREFGLAASALRFALAVEPGRDRKDHLETVWFNFCYSFHSKDDFLQQVSQAERQASTARHARELRVSRRRF